MFENNYHISTAEEVISLPYYMPEAFLEGTFPGFSLESHKLLRIFMSLHQHWCEDLLPVRIINELIPELTDKEKLASTVSELRKGMLYHPGERRLNFRLFDKVALQGDEIHFQFSKESRDMIELVGPLQDIKEDLFNSFFH